VANLRMFLAQVYSVSLFITVFCVLSFVFVEIMSAFAFYPCTIHAGKALLFLATCVLVSVCVHAKLKNC